jgi:hypothetical protein
MVFGAFRGWRMRDPELFGSVIIVFPQRVARISGYRYIR